MANLVTGIMAVLICFGGYILSARYQQKNNYTLAIALLMLCGLILRAYTASDMFLHPWDERFHALVAKNLMHQPFRPVLYENPVLPYDLTNWTANHIWLHKQPLTLWIISLSFRVLGCNEIALRLPSVLLSTIAIYLTYYAGRSLISRKAGYFAALLFSLNGLVIELAAGRASTDHIDIFFLFFIELAIVFSIAFAKSGKSLFNILAGLCTGLALLTKWLPALTVLPVWILLVMNSGKQSRGRTAVQFILLVSLAALIALPWQIWIFSKYPAEAGWESAYNIRHFTEVIEAHTGPFYYFNKLRINYGELIYIPLAWFLWKTLRKPVNKERLAITAWLLTPFIFFSFAQTKMQAYILFTCPALFLMTGEFLESLSDGRQLPFPRWMRLSLAVLLIALPVRYSIERMKPFRITERNPVWAKELRELGREGIKKGILLNYPRPAEAMFYTSLTAYRELPSPEVIEELKNKGYTVLISRTGGLPAGTDSIPGIRYIDLQADKVK